MSLGPVPTTTVIVDPKTGSLTFQWQSWLSRAGLLGGPLGASGPTSTRPVATPQVPLYIGQQFYDTTLGIPVYVQSLKPTVWANASGAAV